MRNTLINILLSLSIVFCALTVVMTHGENPVVQSNIIERDPYLSSNPSGCQKINSMSDYIQVVGHEVVPRHVPHDPYINLVTQDKDPRSLESRLVGHGVLPRHKPYIPQIDDDSHACDSILATHGERPIIQTLLSLQFSTTHDKDPCSKMAIIAGYECILMQTVRRHQFFSLKYFG